MVKTLIVSALLPYPAAALLTSLLPSTSTGTLSRSLTVTSSISLLLLSAALATLSTINFSLGLLVGLLAAPLSFVRHLPAQPGLAKTLGVLLNLVGPPAVVLIGAGVWVVYGGEGRAFGLDEWLGCAAEMLMRASRAWAVEGTWTAVVVWLVWWPAWFEGAVVLASSLYVGEEEEEAV